MDYKKQFFSQLQNSVKKDTFVKMSLGKYRGRDENLQRILVHLIYLKETPHFSFTYRFTTKDITKNFTIKEGSEIIKEIAGREFLVSNLYTIEYDFQLITNKRKQHKMFTKPSSNPDKPRRTHDRQKKRPIEAKNDWLYHLGITTKEGKVKSDKQAKFRQINKFVEIVDSVFKQSDTYLRQQLKVVDMGSGKSYLTFALYDYFHNKLKMQTKVVGIEQREGLVEFSNDLAQKSNFHKLQFEASSIAEAKLNGVQVMVALHACDTATDDALMKAIENEVEVIMVAPCCQHYVRKKMEEPEVIKSITKNGIHKEHLAVLLTDSLRALTLEAFGYKTKVFEFIDQEHTAKNIMITAVLQKRGTFDYKKLEEIAALTAQFGIDDYYLDTLVFESGEDEEE